MLDIRQLQVFVAVWKTRSFSKAAKKVFLTQPTVSGHIKGLEEGLGTKLFDRSGKEVVPTKAGERLYPFAREILKISDRAEREMAAFLEGGKGELDVGGSNIPGQYLLPRLIGDFKKGRPDAHVTLRIGDTSSITDQVQNGDVELGMVGAVIKKTGLFFEPCFDDELVLVVPRGHRFFGSSSVRLSEIASEPFIVREKGSGTRMATEHAFKEAGFPGVDYLHVVAEMGSTESVRQAVKAGVGLAIISRRAVADDVSHGLLSFSLLEGVDLSRKFYLVTNRRRTLSPLAQEFVTFIKDLPSDL